MLRSRPPTYSPGSPRAGRAGRRRSGTAPTRSSGCLAGAPAVPAARTPAPPTRSAGSGRSTRTRSTSAPRRGSRPDRRRTCRRPRSASRPNDACVGSRRRDPPARAQDHATWPNAVNAHVVSASRAGCITSGDQTQVPRPLRLPPRPRASYQSWPQGHDPMAHFSLARLVTPGLRVGSPGRPHVTNPECTLRQPQRPSGINATSDIGYRAGVCESAGLTAASGWAMCVMVRGLPVPVIPRHSRREVRQARTVGEGGASDAL